jgi:hypothetical protein
MKNLYSKIKNGSFREDDTFKRKMIIDSFVIRGYGEYSFRIHALADFSTESFTPLNEKVKDGKN